MLFPSSFFHDGPPYTITLSFISAGRHACTNVEFYSILLIESCTVWHLCKVDIWVNEMQRNRSEKENTWEERNRRKINNTMRNEMVTKRTIFSTVFLHNEIAMRNHWPEFVLGRSSPWFCNITTWPYGARHKYRDNFCLHCRRKRSEMSEARIATRQTVYNSINLMKLANFYLKTYLHRRYTDHSLHCGTQSTFLIS